MQKSARATKKQRELLLFIDSFIKGNNYGPSYREIMRALGYKSVSTVAIHVNGLIKAGFLRKKDNSARSIEVLSLDLHPAEQLVNHEEWLLGVVRSQLKNDTLSEEDKAALLKTLDILGVKDESERQ
jgi:repressor LexA